MKICKIEGCTCECRHNSRYCETHYKERKREQSKERYKNTGPRRYKNLVCENCGITFTGTHSNQRYCSKDCYRSVITCNSNDATNNYENAHGQGYCWMHRRIAENIIGKDNIKGLVVHHIDCVPTNNSLDNLMVMSRGDHVKLHNYLAKQRSLMSATLDPESDSQWGMLVLDKTTMWLEMTGAKVIKLSDIDKDSYTVPADEDS